MESDSSLTDLSSELSSARSSMSPPPECQHPFSYPSPQSSQDNSACASSSEQPSKKRSRDPEDTCPPKKRKTTEAKPRTTVHLDLRSPPQHPEFDQTAPLNLLLKTLRKRRKIVVIAGAGISTSAGGECCTRPHFINAITDHSLVPDFRSSNGLFNTLKSDNKLKTSGKHLFDASVYQTDDSTSSFHAMVCELSGKCSTASPTLFHQMLATLASEGRLMRLYTQNVDGLDTSLPPLESSIPLSRKGPWPKTIQLHGSLEKMVCTKCNNLEDFDAGLFNGPSPPPCLVCVANDEIRTEHAGKRSHGIGRLRPRMVLYNEGNPDDEAIGSVVTADLRARPDAVIVVGTSMEIPGVKRIVREMSGVVRGRRDGVAIWINRGPPPTGKEFEDCWDLVVAGDCDKVAERANMRRWNDEGNAYKDCTESEAERAKQKEGEIKVVIKNRKTPSPRNSVAPKDSRFPGMLTPAESPKFKAAIPPGSFLPPLDLSDKQKKIASKTNPKGTASKKTTSKAAVKAQMNKSMVPNGSKHPGSIFNGLKAMFKVTKGVASTPKKNKPEPAKLSNNRPSPTGPEKARRLLESIQTEALPMILIPPQSARSNGLVSPHKSDCSILKLEKVVLPAVKIEIPDICIDDRLKRMSEEVVSPTGTPPKDMNRLLN